MGGLHDTLTMQATSEWTLDYPPLFAWFELLLSYPAALVDPLIVNIKHTNYASPSCVLYQRFTVIFSDLTLLYALHQLATHPATPFHVLCCASVQVLQVPGIETTCPGPSPGNHKVTSSGRVCAAQLWPVSRGSYPYITS